MVNAHPFREVLRSQGRSVAWLARKIGFSARHTANVGRGHFPTTATFRAKVADALELPASLLFSDQVDAAARTRVDELVRRRRDRRRPSEVEQLAEIA